MAQLDVEVTGRLERETIIERVRARVLPFTAVVLPWIVARLLVVPVMIFRSPHGGGTYPQWLLVMDGGWFRLIALDWYDQSRRRRRDLRVPVLPAVSRPPAAS